MILFVKITGFLTLKQMKLFYRIFYKILNLLT